MNLRQKLYQMFILGTSGEGYEKALQDGLGGIIFFTPDIQSVEQFKELTQKCKDLAIIPPFLSIDQEGGSANIEAKEKIIEEKQELRENNSHAFLNLYSAERFEALVELSQEMNPLVRSVQDFEEREKKIAQLKRQIESPYFARIDFRFEDEDEFEPVYIGRNSLKKDKFGGMHVYDWRSPIASVFYRFMTGNVFYDAPGGRINGEINLKRQYEIKDSKLEYFFDADIEIMDEILRKMLSQNTSPRMKTIVETIQKEQDIIIRDLENDLMMVQGVAGSGKTSIA